MPPRVILIGPPGAGKSSVGKSLARLLAEDFVDTDSVIATQENQSISEIFVDKGETYFREKEIEVLLNQINIHSGVLSLGGGAPLSDVAQSAIKKSGSPVVFLDVTLAGAAPRVGFNRDRPLLLGNPRAQWQELMNVRRPIYESLAHHRVLTDKLTPNEAAAQIVTLLA
ncbi:MAG: shikimate kinase [Actinobacteria bacterium]|nr:shikimate kinase [Actinomycetota bacterium]